MNRSNLNLLHTTETWIVALEDARREIKELKVCECTSTPCLSHETRTSPIDADMMEAENGGLKEGTLSINFTPEFLSSLSQEMNRLSVSRSERPSKRSCQM